MLSLFMRLCLLTVFFTALPLQAKELEGVSMTDTIEVAGQTLRLNGLGLREATFLKIDIYVAGLYLEQKSQDPNTIINSAGPKRLVLKFVHHAEKEKLTEAVKEGFENNGRSSKDLMTKINQFNSYLVEMKEGQEMHFDFLADGSTEVFVNKKHKGSIEGENFSQGLLAIWLGPKPPNTDLKQGLLGK